MHASMPPKRTSRRLRGYPPEAQERVEIGSADEEASPPRGGHVIKNLFTSLLRNVQYIFSHGYPLKVHV